MSFTPLYRVDKMPSAFFLTFLPLLNRLFQASRTLFSLSLTFSRSLRRALTITVALFSMFRKSHPSRVLSLWNFSLSNTVRCRRCGQALIANDCFRRAQSHLETLTALRFAAILWDKCLTRRIIKREAGSDQTAESKRAVFSAARFFSREGVIVELRRSYRIGLSLR